MSETQTKAEELLPEAFEDAFGEAHEAFYEKHWSLRDICTHVWQKALNEANAQSDAVRQAAKALLTHIDELGVNDCRECKVRVDNLKAALKNNE
jgi:hypothetical protein